MDVVVLIRFCFFGPITIAQHHAVHLLLSIQTQAWTPIHARSASMHGHDGHYDTDHRPGLHCCIFPSIHGHVVTMSHVVTFPYPLPCTGIAILLKKSTMCRLKYTSPQCRSHPSHPFRAGPDGQARQYCRPQLHQCKNASVLRLFFQFLCLFVVVVVL